MNSVLQFGTIPKLSQRFGIGQRFEIANGPTVDQIAHGQLDALPLRVRGISETCKIFAGT